MPKQWPAQTQQGNNCKNCLKKEKGVFCHSHLDAREPATAAAAASSAPTGRANAQREWPAQTQKGDNCKNCLKKETGVFCNQHLLGGASTISSKQAAAAGTRIPSSSARGERGWPAQTGADADCKNCLKQERGVFCHLHCGADTRSTSSSTSAVAAVATTATARQAATAQSGWPAQTQKGEDCKNCLKKETDVFCTQHSSRDVSSANCGNPVPAAAAATASIARSTASSASKAATANWPALTAKGTDCSLCYKLGANNFCRHHSSSTAAAAAAAAASVTTSTASASSSATAAERAWPAQTVKGDDCKNCLKQNHGVFCHSHNDSSSSNSAVDSSAAGTAASSSSLKDVGQGG
eukprot:5166-Heterococcus_DN1.PRE.1